MPLRRTLLVAAALFAALWCLMLIGGGRLIVSDAPEPARPTPAEWPAAVPVQAASKVPLLAQGVHARGASVENARGARAHADVREALFAPAVACDANGNVLRGGPYMREAYRAFALEDAGG